MRLAMPVTHADHSLGNEHAPVTLVEYGDFECPSCKQAMPAVKLILAHFAGGIRFVWRHFPLEEVHPHALHAALAAEAAGAQRKFWPMHDRLFEQQSHLKDAQLEHYASELELDVARFRSDVTHDAYLQRVREHIESGRASGVRSTPTFFVNGAVQDVSFGLQALHQRIEAELGK
jgi:protein-disulfide isomerase